MLIGIVLTFSTNNMARAADGHEQKWSSWLGTGAFYGSDDDSRGEVQLFSPFWQNERDLTFFEIRGKLLEHDVNEVNAALGHRSMMYGGWNLGVWLGIDTRKSQIDNRFWQIAGGVEALHPDWDVRVNAYGPLTDPKASTELAKVRLSGNQILMTGGNEVALGGFDVEMGMKVPLRPLLGDHDKRHELRVYAGGFYFDDGDALQHVAGPKIRATWKIDNIMKGLPGSRLELGTRYSYDDVRRDRWEAGIQLVIPLSRSGSTHRPRLTSQQRRMTEGLERDTDIITVDSKAEQVIDAATGAPFNSVSLANGGSLQTTLDAAGTRSLVIAQGGFIGGGTLQADQTLVGGGATLQVRGASSRTIATYTAPGPAASLTHTINSAALILVSNNHIAGLTLQGAGAGGGNIGVSGTGNLGNIAIDDNVIDDFGGTGISLTNMTSSGSVRIANNTVRRPGADGIRFGTASSSVVSAGIHSNVVEDAALDGLQVTVFNSARLDLSITGNTSLRAGADATRFDLQNDSVTNLVFEDNTLTGAASDGLELDIENNSSLVATISNNSIGDTTFGEGIEIDQDQSSSTQVQITGNTISNSFADPLDIDLDDAASGLYQVANNQFASAQPASIIDIDTNDNATLDLQVFSNSSTVNLDFDEDGVSTFRLEDTLSSNTLTGGAALIIDPLIEIVPAGFFFPIP